MVFERTSGVWIGLWLVAVMALVTTLWHEDRFFALGGTPIAEVSKAQRDVSYRSEDDLRWKSIGGQTHAVFDGDKVATGRNSNAMMDFGDGRIAHIGEDTAVGISTIRQSKGVTYILSLPKGLVAIKNSGQLRNGKAKNIFPIIVRSGGKDFLIEPGQEKAIAKTSRGVSEFKGERLKSLTLQKKDVPPEPVFVSEPLPIEVPAPAPVIAVAPPAPPVVAVTAPVKEPTIAKKPLPVVANMDVGGSEIQITSSIPTVNYTFDSLDALGPGSVALEWKEPLSPPSGWNPALELSSGSVSKRILLKKGGRQALAWTDFGALKGQSNPEGLSCVKLTIRGGAQVDGESGPKWSFKKQGVETSLCSYKDAAANVPLVVGLSELAMTGPVRVGIFQQQAAQPLKFQMVVGTPSQYLSLLPLMGRVKYIKTSKVPGYSENGMFIAKSGKIVMQLAGAGFNATAADQMMSLVGGDFVFKGSRSSLYDATQLSVDQLKEWVAKSAQQGKKVYVHRSGTLLPISRDFLEERREVAAFVKAVASQLFVEKVEIIAFK